MPRNWNTVAGNTPIQNGETIWLNPNGVTWESHKFATTKADVGLGNVDDTSDADKPISILTQSALDTKADESNLSAVAFSGDYPDLLNKPTLGTAASQDSSAFATSAQGALADSAVQPNELEDVAFSGDYLDLLNKPAIPAAQVNSDWNSTSGVSAILNKPSLSTVATTGDYNDLANKPTIPTVPVQSVNTKTGHVVLDYTDVGADEAGSALEALNDAKQYTDDEIGNLATVASTGSYNDLSNKPTIPSAQVNSDWNAVSGVSQILNKPTIPAAQIQSDWNQTNTGSADFIKNKPAVPKFYSTSGTTTSGSVTFDVSSAGFTSLTRGGCNIFVNDSANNYSYAVTSISNTSVTVTVTQRNFVGITVVGINVLGSTNISNVPNGTTVYAGFTGL